MNVKHNPPHELTIEYTIEPVRIDEAELMAVAEAYVRHELNAAKKRARNKRRRARA